MAIEQFIDWQKSVKAAKPKADDGKAADEKPKASPAQPTSWDSGAEGPANRIGLFQEAATDFDPKTGKDAPNPNGVKRHRRKIWVDEYLKQGKLTKAQAAIAHNLFAASAGMPSRDPLAALGDKIDSRSGNDPLVENLDRKREFYRMLRMIPLGARVYVDHVVLNNSPIRTMAGCYNGDAANRYMQRLRDGLDAIH